MKAPRFGLATRLTLLTVGLLLSAQLVNAGLLATAEKTLRMQRAEAVMAERLTQAVRFAEVAPNLDRRFARRRGFRIEDGPPPQGEILPRAEASLGDALAEAGFGDRRHVVRLLAREDRELMVAAVELANGSWLSYGQPLPPGGGVPWRAIVVQTLVLSLILIIPAIWVGRVVATPLRQLTAAADGILSGKPAPALPSAGPPDVRALTSAFEKLEQRVLGALEEKTVMLGALGHDLRTPLASLRIRVESVDDKPLREQMITSIEALSATLDDILTFSKGSSDVNFEDVRTDALIRRLAELYEGQPVIIGDVAAVSLRCAPESVLRALRNLVDNALRYGNEAEIIVEKRVKGTAFVVRDNGPGLDEADLERLQRPFVRGEASRNRRSGGAGLGLAIARAVAAAHHGELTLTNRLPLGLDAVLFLPDQ